MKLERKIRLGAYELDSWNENNVTQEESDFEDSGFDTGDNAS